MEATSAAPNYLAGQGALGVEIGSVAIALMLLIGYAMQTRQRGALSIPALCAIGGLSIFWQEFYADWGAYLLWSPSFHMMPWKSTLLTTPDKPWFVIFSYPVFMWSAFAAMLAVTRAAIRRFPNVSPLLVCLLSAGPALFAINLAFEAVSVAYAGQWSYVDVIGPALTTAAGQQPILYPGIPFGLFGGVACYLILRQDAQGRPTFERLLLRPDRLPPGFGRETLRALSWVLVWNLCYWLLLCTPVIAIREIFGVPSTLVP
ncbi:MAG: hypothetical protein JWR16_932 [Nevskia sp.]|nr:hypothetical protein [Nevskia sp.]